MHDLVIRNGVIIDGSGAAKFNGDLAINGGFVSAVGEFDGAGHREIDADGQLVLPGWVDIHTHYDGQATWDPEMSPSSWHGVTTAVFGNCGVGFAPVRPGTEEFLINLMEGVEDIPGTVLAEGIDFSWESYPEYLDVLESMPRVMDIGSQIPHGALRFFVMGERGADHAEIPTAEELLEFERLVAEGFGAGALGFSTSRTSKHKAADGRLTPSLSAGDPELAAIANAMRSSEAGVLQVNSDFGPGEFEILLEASRISKRPLSALIIQVDHSPDLWRQTLEQIRKANAEGIMANGQVGCRPIGVLLGLDATVNPFGNHPAYQAIADLPAHERAALLRTDHALREKLVNDRPIDAFSEWMDYALTRAYELGPELDYEPEPATSVAARAERTSCSPWEVALDLLAEGTGETLLLYPFENYTSGSLDEIHEMLTDAHTICGVGDAGAHVGTICDASYPTYLLTHWGRDRTRGPKIPLEFLVNKQTRRTAETYGLLDRGLLRPGYKADFNVIDFDQLTVGPPELVRDLPAGGKRLVQRPKGYSHTFVSGTEVSCQGEATGQRPGRLVRGAQHDPGQ
ncbi:MAG: amidohydrolase family protein [Actinomycetota bacterium]|nr:amidohydrolase family protein [Acidimicrobiales bacterium]MED5174184.1 amidohydrolase family protein [Actinomycetota bacterium]|tara:strand:- start:517 stop:2229 length:1713 start_codon:yes stop_codon:yes gene_type:complete